MEISPTLTGPLPAAQSGTDDSNGTISSDFETFLHMLTVQMQNQDPLNPVKSEDFAVQLATFSGVEQQVRTNDLLEGLGSQMDLGGMAQVAGWVGMEARAPTAAHFDGTPLSLVPSPQATADKAMLVVKDATGAVVQRTQIAVSGDPIDWSGADPQGNPFPPGAYSFEVESYSNGALAAKDPVEVYTRVAEARVVDGETVLVLQGGIEVAPSQVTGLRDPDPGS
ncbi:MAG: flagellar hook capping FlgD N-terminal domain-containing protein [Rhodobacter sp.]|nr:flagellar hook capping FlgD N-terminal domain-containing protein [Rhodobacter sp.]